MGHARRNLPFLQENRTGRGASFAFCASWRIRCAWNAFHATSHARRWTLSWAWRSIAAGKRAGGSLNTTQTEAEAGQSNTLYIVLISGVATIGGFLFGFDSGVINGTVDGLRTAFHSDSIGTGFNVASMLLGCAAGAFFAGRLADRYGRRFIMRIAAAFFVVSAWGSGAADGVTE